MSARRLTLVVRMGVRVRVDPANAAAACGSPPFTLEVVRARDRTVGSMRHMGGSGDLAVGES
jgi:hypothetical protein